MIRALAATLAAFYFGYLYVRVLARFVGEGERLQFRLLQPLGYMAVIVVLIAIGWTDFPLAATLLIVYEVVCGPYWKRVIAAWTRMGPAATLCWTSVVIVGSFVAVLTALAVLLLFLSPTFVVRSALLDGMLWTSGVISFLFILGDNARDGTRLVLTGLPVGVPLHIVLGMAAGSLAALLAFAIRPTREE